MLRVLLGRMPRTTTAYSLLRVHAKGRCRVHGTLLHPALRFWFMWLVFLICSFRNYRLCRIKSANRLRGNKFF